jgi:uncharacterized protein (DUF302 family)
MGVHQLHGVDEVTMPSQAPDGVATKTSARPVPATLERLQAAVREKGLMVFALVDHSGEAAKAGLSMPDTKLLVFGSPAGRPQRRRHTTG